MEIPHRTASRAKSGWFSAPAELHAWRIPGPTSNRDTASRKISNWRRVLSSSDPEHAQRVTAHAGHRHRAVAIAVRLDDGEQLCPARHVALDVRAVGADRPEVDLRPPK